MPGVDFVTVRGHRILESAGTRWSVWARSVLPSRARTQPEQSRVYTGLDTIALTSDEPQVFVVQLRGQVYYVEAIPVDFTWDFDDGSPPLTTTDPGQPWPDPPTLTPARNET